MPYSGEFVLSQPTTNSTELAFRCTVLTIMFEDDPDELNDTHLQYLNDIASTLNAHFLEDHPEYKEEEQPGGPEGQELEPI